MSDRLGIVLAAGMGTRMKSDLPKVLFPVCGRPMIHFVLDALTQAGVGRILVVIGHRAEAVRAELANRPVEFVEQTERLGTGHAVKMCLPAMAEHQGSVVVLAGDSPLVQVSSLESLFNEFDRNRPACLLGTLHKDNPAGLGRIVRSNDGRFEGIVEEKDATPLQREITEVNMSTYVFEAGELRHALQQLRNENRQKEYYLTDCPGILLREGKDVRALPVLKACESFSINTPDELQIVEAEMRKLGYPSY
ncbi:MAG: hypothetical protein RIS70_2511 [Planctomycetota bacterium]|jgi:bifunctional UDP-N-acetylglucosamine pyrophosphorylase/glucosamine-1-phosphate N-acetyltransferase/UDP-N-acetylglucosamine pyrophosphorylase